jgi:phenylacetate-CoA ligase
MSASGSAQVKRGYYLASISAFDLWHLFAAARKRGREQWWQPERIAEARGRRLQRLAEAAAHTTHYRELFQRAGLQPADLTEATLPHLPVLEKAALHASVAADTLVEAREKLFPVTTSGSTGTPLQVFRNSHDQAEVSALWARIFKAYGHRFRDGQFNINTGGTVARKGPVASLRKLGLLPQLHQISSFASVDEHVELLRRVKPSMFSSYAISLELIAERVLEAGITDIRPRVVYSCAMPISDRGRTLVEQAFGVPALDVYVSAELGPLAWECADNRGVWHINDDVQILEILDDQDRRVPDGEVGQVVVTQLCCTAQPLIRYRIGDLAARLTSRCTCGRGLALLSAVQGRTRHVIRMPDGRVLHGTVLSTVLKVFPEVARWQATQPAPDLLRILVVPTAHWSDGSADAIKKKLAERLGESARYEVQVVQHIPLSPAGKFQTIVPYEPNPQAPTSPSSGSS